MNQEYIDTHGGIKVAQKDKEQQNYFVSFYVVKNNHRISKLG